MSRRDENTSTGVVLAAATLLVFAAFVGAWFLPPGVISTLFRGKWAAGVLAAALIGVPVLLRLAQRNRIQIAVEELGGRIVRLKRLPFWRQGDWRDTYTESLYGYPWWRGVLYEVEFTDLLGAPHRAVCRSGFLRGVQWCQELQG